MGSVGGWVGARCGAGHLGLCDPCCRSKVKDIISYNSVIHASAKQGDIKRAEWWLAAMRDGGAREDASLYLLITPLLNIPQPSPSMLPAQRRLTSVGDYL